jgi:hypothetical protein
MQGVERIKCSVLFNYVKFVNSFMCLLISINQCDVISEKVCNVDVDLGYQYVFIIISIKLRLIILKHQTTETTTFTNNIDRSLQTT